jgi:hypothetical protein
VLLLAAAAGPWVLLSFGHPFLLPRTFTQHAMVLAAAVAIVAAAGRLRRPAMSLTGSVALGVMFFSSFATSPYLDMVSSRVDPRGAEMDVYRVALEFVTSVPVAADTPGTMLFWYPNRPGSSLNSIQSTHLWGYSKLQGSEVGRGLPHLGAREIERLQGPGVRWLGMLADDEARLDRGRDALVQHGITWRLVRRRALTAGRHTVYFELLELGAGREDVATTRRP